MNILINLLAVLGLVCVCTVVVALFSAWFWGSGDEDQEDE